MSFEMKVGEFQNSSSITSCANVFIHVCDHYNHQVQIINFSLFGPFTYIYMYFTHKWSIIIIIYLHNYLWF